jgi:type II secretory pathway pseudopilin PulG
MNSTMRRRVIGVGLFAFVAICVVSLPLSKLAARREYERHTHIIADIRALGTQLDDYKRLKGHYPTSEQGLRVLAAPPKDPWLNDYVYRCPGIHNRGGYDLFSAGADCKPDTADDDWGEQ